MSYRPIDALTMALKNLEIFQHVEGMEVNVHAFSKVIHCFIMNPDSSPTKLIKLLRESLKDLRDEKYIKEADLSLDQVAQQALLALDYAFPSKESEEKTPTSAHYGSRFMSRRVSRRNRSPDFTEPMPSLAGYPRPV